MGGVRSAIGGRFLGRSFGTYPVARVDPMLKDWAILGMSLRDGAGVAVAAWGAFAGLGLGFGARLWKGWEVWEAWEL